MSYCTPIGCDIRAKKAQQHRHLSICMEMPAILGTAYQMQKDYFFDVAAIF